MTNQWELLTGKEQIPAKLVLEIGAPGMGGERLLQSYKLKFPAAKILFYNENTKIELPSEGPFCLYASAFPTKVLLQLMEEYEVRSIRVPTTVDLSLYIEKINSSLGLRLTEKQKNQILEESCGYIEVCDEILENKAYNLPKLVYPYHRFLPSLLSEFSGDEQSALKALISSNPKRIPNIQGHVVFLNKLKKWELISHDGSLSPLLQNLPEVEFKDGDSLEKDFFETLLRFLGQKGEIEAFDRLINKLPANLTQKQKIQDIILKIKGRTLTNTALKAFFTDEADKTFRELVLRGISARNENNLEISTEWFSNAKDKAIALSEKAEVLRHLAVNEFKVGKVPSALKYYEEAFQVEPGDRCSILYDLANCHLAMGDEKIYQTYIQKAKSKAEKENREDVKIAALQLEFLTSIENGEVTKANQLLKQMPLPKLRSQIFYTELYLGDFYLLKGNFPKAQKKYFKAIDLGHKFQVSQFEGRAWLGLFKLAILTKNTPLKDQCEKKLESLILDQRFYQEWKGIKSTLSDELKEIESIKLCSGRAFWSQWISLSQGNLKIAKKWSQSQNPWIKQMGEFYLLKQEFDDKNYKSYLSHFHLRQIKFDSFFEQELKLYQLVCFYNQKAHSKAKQLVNTLPEIWNTYLNEKTYHFIQQNYFGILGSDKISFGTEEQEFSFKSWKEKHLKSAKISDPTLFYCPIKKRVLTGEVSNEEDEALKISLESKSITCPSGEKWNLETNPQLFSLLISFFLNPYLPFSKEDIVLRIWHEKYDPLRHDQPVYNLMSKVRKGLERIIPQDLLKIQTNSGNYLLISKLPYSIIGESESWKRPGHITARQVELIQFLRFHPNSPKRKICENLSIPERTLVRELSNLVKLSALERRGTGPATHYKINESFFLTGND